MPPDGMLTRVSLGSSYEQLISIEDSSDLDPESAPDVFLLGKDTIDPINFETDINRLKAENASKFKRRWDEIIAKFSSIDDEKESDEIDLYSGKITIDNGHLRSLRSADNVIDGIRVHSSIWAGDYDFDKQLQHQKRRQKSVSQNKHELKQKLKAERKFHNSSVVNSDSDALEDNLLILGSSPTKKHKCIRDGEIDGLKLPLDTSSPLLRSPRSKGAGSSPLKKHVVHSPLKKSPKTGMISRGQSQDLRLEKQRYTGSTESFRTTKLHEPYEKSSNELSHSHKRTSSNEVTSIHEFTDAPEFTVPELTDSFEHTGPHATSELHGPTHQHGMDPRELTESLFEQTLLLEWSRVPDLALYSCAFRDCGIVSESRLSYRIHLLRTHSPELQEIGYPVVASPQKGTPFVDEITILKLNLHFPLQVELPKSNPYVCGLAIGRRSCRKLFFHESELLTHRRASPISCSAKRQVLSCPILGCTFMTDVSFEDYRVHMTSHHMRENPGKCHLESIEADVSDYFSDSVSSLSFTDSEPGKCPSETPKVHLQASAVTETPSMKEATSSSSYQLQFSKPKIEPPPALHIVD